MLVPEEQAYCMKWNNYQIHIRNFLVELLQSEALVDVTLCAEGQRFHCHRVLLSACSSYFQEILSNAESKHPIILLPETRPEDLKAIIDFIYHGELNNINYNQLTSILRTAEILKIDGLTELIDHLPSETKNYTSSNAEEVDTVEIEKEEVKEEMVETTSKNSCSGETVLVDIQNDEIESIPRKQTKRITPKRYSAGNLNGAISDIKKGMTLMEAARLHKIPRSTLYMKAKHSGLNLVTRREHSNQECQVAIQAVAGGMSLQRASEEYGIPKTVIWRRVQKMLEHRSDLKDRRKVSRYPRHIKEAAVRAIVNGEKLGNVSAQYQIPVSTLFKEKVRLEKNGTIESVGSKVLKQVRLTQAVEACKEGKMSQAAASSTFQVPKTTIWRRLQKSTKTSDGNVENTDEAKKVLGDEEHILKDTASFITKEDEAKVAYLENDEFAETPLIILTHCSEGEIIIPVIGEEDLQEVDQ